MLNEHNYLDYEDALLKAHNMIDEMDFQHSQYTEEELAVIDMNYLYDHLRPIVSANSKEIMPVAKKSEWDVYTGNLSDKEKDIYLFVISEIKYICDGYADVMDMAPNDSGRSYDERLDSCIDYELDQIFNHSSVIKQIGFIAGLPETFLALAAECAIMAVADPGDPRMNR